MNKVGEGSDSLRSVEGGVHQSVDVHSKNSMIFTSNHKLLSVACPGMEAR